MTSVEYARFEAKYIPEPNSGCWLWTGAISANGYGALQIGGRMRGAHRASLEHRLGRALAPGCQALHRCDTRCCVNPDHLFEGSQADNMTDMVAKQRALFGSRNPSAKLTPSQVLEILASSGSQRDVARMYGVSQPLIGMIRRRAIWSVVA